MECFEVAEKEVEGGGEVERRVVGVGRMGEMRSWLSVAMGLVVLRWEMVSCEVGFVVVVVVGMGGRGWMDGVVIGVGARAEVSLLLLLVCPSAAGLLTTGLRTIE